LRGGNYNNTARNCRSAYRNNNNPYNPNNNYGCRLALSHFESQNEPTLTPFSERSLTKQKDKWPVSIRRRTLAYFYSKSKTFPVNFRLKKRLKRD
jgi:hypothetical protein